MSRGAFSCGSTLGRARVDAGLTQQELAEKAGVHQTVVSRAERGGKLLAGTAEQIAQALGRTLRDFWPTLANAVEEGRLLDTVIPVDDAVTEVVAGKRRGLRLAYSAGGRIVRHRHRPPICCGAQWCRCVDLEDPETYPVFGDPKLIEIAAGGVNG